MFLLDQLQQTLFNLTQNRKFLVAYSGGMDSHVLLYGLAQLRKQNPEITVRAIHVHHNLSVDADQWVEHCLNVCAQLNIALKVCYVDAKNSLPKGHSPEAVARELRYRVIADNLLAAEDLIVAHHLDDQGETLLLQLFRGAGVQGLAAMPKSKKFVGGELQAQLLRPLLNFSREQLHQYAVQHNLIWIEDESNENIGFDRNYVRHKLLPEIVTRWPSVLNCLSRSAENCAETFALTDELAAHDLEQVMSRCCWVKTQPTLSVTALLKLSQERLNNVLRYWLRQLNLPLPSRAKLQQIYSTVLTCRIDAHPLVAWSGVEVRRYRDGLYVMLPLPLFDSAVVLSWSGRDSLQLPGNLGVLQPKILQRFGIKQVNDDDFTVCFRAVGAGVSLKKRFQELGVPPWLRDRVPLLYRGDELLGIIV